MNRANPAPNIAVATVGSIWLTSNGMVEAWVNQPVEHDVEPSARTVMIPLQTITEFTSRP